MEQLPEQVKLAGDAIAIAGWISALAGAVTGILGVVAAIGSAAWVWLRVYETKTVQEWVKRRRK